MKTLLTICLFGLFFTGFAGEDEKKHQNYSNEIKGYLSQTLAHYPKDKVVNLGSTEVSLTLEANFDGSLKIVSIHTEDPVLKAFVKNSYSKKPIQMEGLTPGTQFNMNLLFK